MVVFMYCLSLSCVILLNSTAACSDLCVVYSSLLSCTLSQADTTCTLHNYNYYDGSVSIITTATVLPITQYLLCERDMHVYIHARMPVYMHVHTERTPKFCMF